MNSTRHEPTNCPACGYNIDAATALRGDAKPSPGDVTICLSCAVTLFFQEDMALRIATQKEESNLPPDALLDILRVKLFIAAKIDKSKLGKKKEEK